MLIQQTIEQLHALRLTGMAAALSEQQGQRDLTRLSFEDRLALLVWIGTCFAPIRMSGRIVGASLTHRVAAGRWAGAEPG